MTLLGTPLLVTLGAIAFLLPVLGVYFLPRCRGGRIVAVAQRLGLVVACQLAALMVAAAAINDYGYFFASWSQLTGIAHQALGPGQQYAAVQARHLPTGSSPASAGTITMQGDAGTSDRRRWPLRGRIASVGIVGAASGLRSHAFVYLPPEYFQRRYALSKFPAAEVMTGYPGNDIGLIRGLRYQDVLQQLVRAHRARPMVLVMLRPSVTFPRDTECTDVPGGPQALTFFSGDVPAQIAHVFRVRPTGWGAVGNSTGGYCAAKITMMHPLVFSAAVSLSGYYFALRDVTTGDLWNRSRVLRNLNDLKWRLRHIPPPPVSLLIGTSRSEVGTAGYAEARSFVSLAKAPLVADLLVADRGGHNYATWGRQLPVALKWLSGKLGGA